MSGLLITVEGGDGAGKSTLAAALAERWRADGRDVETTREPGGTLFGQGLRELLLDAEMAMGSWTETLLFLADRSEHVTRVIGPAWSGGRWCCATAMRIRRWRIRGTDGAWIWSCCGV